jgi:integrase
LPTRPSPPEHAQATARVLAIPAKKFDRAIVTWLTEPEVEALLSAPDKATWAGRRDHAMLTLAARAGLRVSELTGLTCGDACLGSGPHVSCHGKGRKERITPLTTVTVTVLRAWAAERGGEPEQPLFPNRTGGKLSRDAVEKRLALHVTTAAGECPSLKAKNVAAHTLRHTAAMRLLHAPASTPRSSRSGSVTSRPTRLRSTSMPISNSRRRHWPGPHRQTRSPGATSPRTSSSPSSKASDYADLSARYQAATCHSGREVGISRRSA